MINIKLKKLVSYFLTWPFVGKLLRIFIDVIRAPQYRIALLELSNRQENFEKVQFPAILQTISNFNSRLIEIEHSTENLIKSLPVSMRQVTRELQEIRGQVDGFSENSARNQNNLFEPLARRNDEDLFSLKHSQLKINELTKSVDYLFSRVEFVRREIMYELRYGGSSSENNKEKINSGFKILNHEKLEDAKKSQLKINLGCGHIPLKSYLNIDRRELTGVDIVAEVDDLPFVAGEVHEIFSSHLLEHFPQEQLRRSLLPYYFNLLRDGGTFTAIVPDAAAMLNQYVSGNYPYDDMREVMYGAQDYQGDFHFNMFTPESIQQLLVEAGFKKVIVIEKGRRNGKCFELEITAQKVLLV